MALALATNEGVHLIMTGPTPVPWSIGHYIDTKVIGTVLLTTLGSAIVALVIWFNSYSVDVNNVQRDKTDQTRTNAVIIGKLDDLQAKAMAEHETTLKFFLTTQPQIDDAKLHIVSLEHNFDAIRDQLNVLKNELTIQQDHFDALSKQLNDLRTATDQAIRRPR